MLLGTLRERLSGNFLTGKGVMATSQGRRIHRTGKVKVINRAGNCRSLSSALHDNKIDF